MLCIWLEYLYNRGKDRRTDTHLLSSSLAEVRKNTLISLFCWNMLLGWVRLTRCHPHCRAKQDQRKHSHVVVLFVSVLQKTQVSMSGNWWTSLLHEQKASLWTVHQFFSLWYPSCLGRCCPFHMPMHMGSAFNLQIKTFLPFQLAVQGNSQDSH